MKKKAILSAILLAASVMLSLPPSAQAKADCHDGVICAVPWNPYNCAPIDVLVDCSVCTVTFEMP